MFMHAPTMMHEVSTLSLFSLPSLVETEVGSFSFLEALYMVSNCPNLTKRVKSQMNNDMRRDLNS